MEVLNMGVRDRYNEKKKKETQSNTSPSPASTSSGVAERYKLKKYYQTLDIDSVNQDYIDSFVSDTNNFFKSSEETYNGIDWYNASSVYDSTSNTLKDLKTRGDTIKAWLDKNKDRIKEEDYNNLYTTLNGINGSFDTVIGGFQQVKDFYSSFKNEDKYKDYLAGVQRQTELKNYDLTAGATEIAELESIYNSTKDQLDSLNLELVRAIDNRDVNKVKSIRTQIEEAENKLEQYGDIESILAEKRAYYGEAERLQNGIKLTEEAKNDADFATYSQQGASIKNPTLDDAWGGFSVGSWRPFGEDIGNIVTFSRQYADEELAGIDGNNSPRLTNDLYGFMTDEEVSIYNYYLAKDGKEKASEYLSAIEGDLTARQASGIVDNIGDNGFLKVAFLAVSGMVNYITGAKNLFKDEEYYAPSATQMAVAEIQDSFDTWFGKVVGDLAYTTGNMLPSILVGTVTGGIVGNITMGLSAMGNAKAEMINLGYSKDQATAYGALVGASEAGLQYLLGGISSLGGKASGGLIQKVLTKVDNAFARTAIKLGGSMLSEGFEESLQTVLEPWFKSIVTGVDFEAADLGDVLYSGLLGALSAGLLEGAGTIGGEVSTYKTGKLVQNVGTVDRLTKLGSTFAADSVAYKIAKKVNKNTGAYTIGRLLNEVDATLTEQNKSEIRKSLKRKGMLDADIETHIKWLNEVVEGATITDEQALILNSNEIVSKTFNDVIINQNSTVNQRSKAYSQTADIINKGVIDKKASNGSQTAETSKVETSLTPTPSEGSTASNTSETKADDNGSVDPQAKTTYDGNEVNIKEVSAVKDGEVFVRLDDGRKVSTKYVNFDKEEDGLVYEHVANMNPATAQYFIDGFNKGKVGEGKTISLETYIRGFDEAYKIGSLGVPYYSISKDGMAALLSETQRKIAYNRGRIDSVAKVEAQQKGLNEKKTTVSKTENTEKKKGKVYFEKGVYAKNNRQKTSIKALKVLADALGINIHIFESPVDATGKHSGKNGWYDPSDNSIHIDLYAGADGKSTILFTAAHELTHFIREWSPKKFKTFADFLLAQYGVRGVSVEQLVRSQIDKAKRNGRDIDYDTAYEEVIADACEAMLTDSNAIKKLAMLKAKDRGLVNKIKTFINNLVEKIKKAYAKLAPDSVEAKLVRGMVDVAEQLQTLWTDALMDAGATYQAVGSKDSATTEQTKHSDRDNFDWNSEEAQIITSAMDMATCRQMIERTYRIVNPNQYEEKPIYRNAEEWLADVGADEVALYIENEYILQEKYLDKIPAYIDGDVYVSEIIEAYQAGVLKGSNNKAEAVRLDVSKGVDTKDSRFYAPQKVEGVKALFETANQKLTNANRDEVTKARAKILLFAHNRGAVEELGITQSELNKKLRSWSHYSAKARDISERINKGVALSNVWTGIENSSYLYNSTVTEEDFSPLVGSISGNSSAYERRFIASTMLALDTHIDYTGIKFVFGVNNFDRGSVLGQYEDHNRTVSIKRGSGLNTVAHEIGHAIDHQWWRDVYKWSGRKDTGGHSPGLSENVINLDLITDSEVKQWIKNFQVFVDNISDSSSIYNEYTQSKNEVFARFVAQFVEWTMQIATGRNQSFGYSSYSDKFTGAQFIEFAKILQEKAKLDSKYQKETVKYSDRDSAGNTLTKEQQEFFKDSKVRDKDGNLLVVYHGSPKKFTVFDSRKVTGYKNNFNFFTPNKEYSEGVGFGANGTVYKVYLNIQNPYYLNADGQKLGDLDFDKDYWHNNEKVVATLISYGYDGLIVGEKHFPDEIISFNSNQIKLTNNKTPTSDPDIRYSERYQSAEENSDILALLDRVASGNFKANEKVYFGTVSDNIAKQIQKLTGINVTGFKVAIEARQVEHILKGHGQHGTTDKSMADASNIAKMEYVLNEPDDIRNAGKTQAYSYMLNGKNRTADTVLYEKEIGEKSYYVVQAVPDTKAKTLYIVTAFIGKKGYKKEAPQLINAKSLDATAKTGSVDASKNTIPQNPNFVNINPKNSQKYSERDPQLAEQREKINKVLESENAKLKEDNQYLKELVKLQRKQTHGTKFTKSSVQIVASKLMKYARANGNRAELVQLLNNFYEHIANGENLAWEEITETAQPAVNWLKQHVVNQKTKLDPHAREILDNLRSKRIYLNKDQQSEAAYVYGSFYEYRKKAMGSLMIVNKDNPNGAIALESVWYELAELYPDYFDSEVTVAEMPARLLDIIDALRNFHDYSTDYEYADDMVEQDLLLQVYDSYWDVSTLHTAADSYQKQINLLKHKHHKQIAELREFHNEKHNQLKKDYQEKITRIKSEYRERNAKTTRELMNRYQESRAKATEGRHKTEMKHKIQKVVKELKKLLLSPTKDKHVKEELQRAVAEALWSINMDTVGADERVAKYNDLIAKSSDPDVIQELTDTRDRIQFQGENLKDKLDALKSAYEKIKNSKDAELSNAYQEVVLNSISNTLELVGDTPIRYMSLEQLEAVYEMYSMVLHTVRTANKMFKESKYETLVQTAEAVNSEVRLAGGEHYKRTALGATLNKIGWTFLKPFTAFRTIGSKTLTSLYNNLRSGEDTYYVDIKEAQDFIQEQYKKHNFSKWDMKQTKEFTAKSGKTFSLTLEQMMSIFAYSRREQAKAHLLEGGIVLDDAVQVVEKNKLGLPVKYEVTTKSAFNLSEGTLLEIIDSLTDEQKAFVKEMQSYLSDTMGAKGNEISMEMYGIKLFKEAFYFPIKSSSDYMGFKPEEAGEIKLKNPSFSKETVRHANNPVVLSNFTDVWANHVNDMSMYHSFVLPLEDFTRVFNYKTRTDAMTETMSTEATIANAYGKGATQYIRNFLKSLNGGVRVQGTPADKLISLTKKGAVLASASVTIQQPSAVMRAMAYIKPKYFIKSTPQALNLVNHKKDWAEIKQYAPIAGIKEMGHFDIGLGQSTVDWIKSNKTTMEKVDEVLTKAPAYMDELTWVSIWQAVKREVLDTTDLKFGTKAYLEKVGERFTEVVSLSQVYDSVFARSDLMRNTNPLAKMLTSFMAEPSTTLNMLFDSWVQGKRSGSKKAFAKITASTSGAVVASIVFNSMLKSLVIAMRDDDEDESYIEKYFGAFSGDLKDNLNPLTLIPVVKDVVSIFNGYDVERMDMSLFSDLRNAIDAFDSESKTAYEKWSGLVGAISAFFGVPIKNVERDIRGFINTMETFFNGEKTTSAGIWNSIREGWSGKESSKTQQLYEAYLNDDQEQIKRVEGRFKDKSDIEAALRKALRENDPRIREAAQAVIDGNQSERIRITKEIKAEGHFKQDTIVAAINAELTAMRRENKE